MQQSIVRATMTNGLILGALFSANFLISLSKTFIGSILSLAIFVYILVYTYKTSIKNRERNLGGEATYIQAVLFIVLSFFYAGIISSIVKFVYFQFINPEYLTLILDEGLRIMEQMKFPVDPEAYDQIKDLLKPASFSLQYIWMNTILGIFTGSIMAIFVKKDKNIFES